jgi:hypothetical protein
MGEKGFREVFAPLILYLSVLIQAYKAILAASCPRNPVNSNFYPNPKFKKLILLRICLEITCPVLRVLLLVNCVENTRHSYCYVCVFRLIGEQNNCLKFGLFISEQILT